TPPAAVGHAVRSMAPRLVGLSACTPLRSPKALVRAYGRACEGTSWVVGGAAAASLRSTVEAEGGHVAVGASGSWQPKVREWLRAPRMEATTGTRGAGRRGAKR